MQNHKSGGRNVKAKLNTILIPFTVLGAIIFFLVWTAPTLARSAASTAAARGPQAASSQSQGPAGATLVGTWKLNRALSDDPAKKLVADDDIATGETGTAVPMPGASNHPNGSQMPQSNLGSAPSGMSGIGGSPGMPGMGGIGGGAPPMPATPPSHRWETDKDREKRLEGILPASSLTIEQKENEVDLDDLGRKAILYTDARKLRKSKNDTIQEFTARWDKGNLTYDEKRPPHGTITRSFELSLDGRRMTETMTIDNGSISVPVVLKYVYDAAPAEAQR
jgi:hypothetical protein